ncbi:alpha/beta-hydrolase [Thozetella sp. PMI_491]|nr:alpha/beta-hydrolase [Thozetella sp. PMI_491]
MVSLRLSSFSTLLLSHLLPQASAQFPPFAAANVTTITSPFDQGVKISYKVPDGVCNTAFKSQQQYTGWVNVPGDFPTNLFFWFVAARQPTSSLTIWLNGGPGSSSMFGFFSENGPCQIVEQGADRLGTVAREWGWDRASNMLFIDQPSQVGFSYDTPTNGSLDFLATTPAIPALALPTDRPPTLFQNGTFSSNHVANTANTSETAGLAIWHMLQGFLGTFPQFNPVSNVSTRSSLITGNSSVGVNLFAESYGGKYGPVFADVWEQQNTKRRAGALANSTLDIKLVSLGIVNGCVDEVVQGPSYTGMLVNNTYGLQLASSVEIAYHNATFYQPGACRDLVLQCRSLAVARDPQGLGNDEDVNEACSSATITCNDQLMQLYAQSGLSEYDIAHKNPDSFPPSYYVEYLNTRTVQEAIGAVVNFTNTGYSVYNAFLRTGDWVRRAPIPELASLLQKGVRIGLVYGDRDYVCNWLGGEALSMELASAVGGLYATRFPSAGYAPIIVNDSYIGGVVRQFGNLSFSRIYQAGHYVPAYQPETAFQVFARIILGNSVSTGEPVSLMDYNTTGPAKAISSLPLPANPSPTCYVRLINSTCPQDAISSILQNEGVIINGVWYAESKDWPGMTMTATSASDAATSTSTTATLTGLFTATSTPSSAASKPVRWSPKTNMAMFLMGAIILDSIQLGAQ